MVQDSIYENVVLIVSNQNSIFNSINCIILYVLKNYGWSYISILFNKNSKMFFRWDVRRYVYVTQP